MARRQRKRNKKLHLKFMREKAEEMRTKKRIEHLSGLSMGKIANKKKKISLRALRKMNKEKGKHFRQPKSLVTLCERVIKKHKLVATPEPKKFTPPETFSVVGGKPLRKRSPVPGKYNERKKKERKVKKWKPKSLAALCQLVIEEYNLLPETDEGSEPRLIIDTDALSRKRSRSHFEVAEKRPRGRPRKSCEDETTKKPKPMRPRGRPRKDSKPEEIQESTGLIEEPINYSYVRIKDESASDEDPLQGESDEEDCIIQIKMESCDDEIANVNPLVSQTVRTPQPGSSKTNATMPHYATVVMDQYQIFANRIAEQLRQFPPRIATLLQTGIQAMIDNERQLLEDDN